MGTGGAALGPRQRRRARPSHPDLPGRHHRPGLPHPRRGAASPAGHPPPAPRTSARSGHRPRCSLRRGLLCRAGFGGPARRARPARARELAPWSCPTAAARPSRRAAAPVCLLSAWTGGLTMPALVRGPRRGRAPSPALPWSPAPARSAEAASRSGRALSLLSGAPGLPACAPAEVPVLCYLQTSVKPQGHLVLDLGRAIIPGKRRSA